MRKFSFLIVFVLTAFISLNAQESDKKEINDRELEWSDFVGEIDNLSKYDAVTNWVTSYSFPRPTIKENTVWVTVTVRLFLRSNSWVRPNKKSLSLLEHERGHFKIGKICAREIETTINSTGFDRYDYAKQIDAVYWKIIGKYKEFEKQYDTDTNHYQNREQQALWNKKLNELLKR